MNNARSYCNLKEFLFRISEEDSSIVIGATIHFLPSPGTMDTKVRIRSMYSSSGVEGASLTIRYVRTGPTGDSPDVESWSLENQGHCYEVLGVIPGPLKKDRARDLTIQVRRYAEFPRV